LPINFVHRVIGKIGDVKTALLRIRREIRGAGGAGCRLGRHGYFSDETAFAGFTSRVLTRFADLRCLEDLYAVVAAVADIEKAVVTQLDAMHGAAEEVWFHLAAAEIRRPFPGAFSCFSTGGDVSL